MVVTNVGSGAGELVHMNLEAEARGLEIDWTDDNPDDDARGTILAPDESLTATVQYSAREVERIRDTLLVRHSEAEEPVEIPIGGEARLEPVPDIHAEPARMEVGTLEYGDSISQDFAISNVGWGPLDINLVRITGPGERHFAITFDNASDRSLLPEDAPALVTVAFAPQANDLLTASLEIHSITPGADPDENPLIIPLSGRGEGAPEVKPPVPVCGATIDDARPLERVDLDGTASWDPGGFLPLTYQWELAARPDGSSAFIELADTARPWFLPDNAGEYVARLRVVNAVGVPSSTTCETLVNVRPLENFRIEMYWDIPEDIDLHLLRFDGAALGGNDDCWGLNCSVTHTPVPLDWWTPGIGPEDPSLDIDDNTGFGTGPENTTIDDPMPSTYVVVAHDWPSPPTIPTYLGTNTIHINVWLDGVLAAAYEFPMTGDDTCWEVVKVAWPSGAIVDGAGLIGCNGLSGVFGVL